MISNLRSEETLLRLHAPGFRQFHDRRRMLLKLVAGKFTRADHLQRVKHLRDIGRIFYWNPEGCAWARKEARGIIGVLP